MYEIQVLAWERHNNVVGLNHLMVSKPSSLDNSLDLQQQYIYHKQTIKSCTGSFTLKNTTYYHKNEWQHNHGLSMLLRTLTELPGLSSNLINSYTTL
jgi:hypothetical protein